MKTLIAALLLMLPLSSFADTQILSGFETYHFHNNSKLNDNNYGIGIVHNGWVAGYYRNSYDKNSFYVGHEWLTKNPHWNIGLELAAVTGYDNKTFQKLESLRHPIDITLAPEITYTHDRFTVAAIIAPPIAGETNGNISFQLRYKVGK